MECVKRNLNKRSQNAAFSVKFSSFLRETNSTNSIFDTIFQIIVYNVTLNYIILHYIISYNIILYHIIIYYIISCYTTLYYILYCTQQYNLVTMSY